VKLGVDCGIGINNGLEMTVNQAIVSCRNGTSYATIIYVFHIHVWLCSYNCYGVKSRKFFRYDTLTMSRLLTRYLYNTKRQFKSLRCEVPLLVLTLLFMVICLILIRCGQWTSVVWCVLSTVSERTLLPSSLLKCCLCNINILNLPDYAV